MNKHDIINSALRANAGKSVRAEDLKNYSHFFVEPIQTQILEENTNQLIYGRRGSGKTLLLGTLNEKIQANFMQTKRMSFYYTATRFRSSAEPGGLTPTVKEKTHAYYYSFIEQLCHDISNFADTIFEKPKLIDLFKLGGDEQAARRDLLVTSVLELMEVASYGADFPLLSSVHITRENVDEAKSSTSRGRGASASAAVSTSGVKTHLQGHLEGAGALETSIKRVDKTLIESQRSFSPSRIRELLVRIIELLDLEYLTIFIDEWMSLAECQIEFAERLRQSLFGEDRIAVKIAADPFQGQFNNGGQGYNYRGLEIDADIFPAVNLDLPFRDPEKQFDLFSQALYRRLLHFEPRLAPYFGPPPLADPSDFVGSVFATKNAFNELCNGAHGLCRDFHTLFQMCSKKLSRSTSGNKVDFDTVRHAILDKTESTYGRAVKSIDSNALLFNVIRPHIMRTSSRYFILESGPSAYTTIINDLLSKRIIHNVPISFVHPTLRGEYNCFEVEYGIYLDLMRAMEFATGVSVDDSYVPAEVSTITSNNKPKYLLNLSPLEGAARGEGRLILCPHCSNEFSSKEKAYQIRRMCPHCFADQ